MTKKIMMVAVLLGTLTLGACVDNKESASVEAVRNAKAEQLKGLAALANAQAEAEKIVSEAEAALRNAKAELQKNKTEEAKQRFAVEIEVIKAQAEANIAQAKRDALKAEKEILDNANEVVQKLYTIYSTHASELSQMNYNLFTETASLAGLDADIVTAKAWAKMKAIEYNRTIKSETAKLEVLKDPANAGIDKDELAAKKSTVQQKLDLEWSTIANNEGAALNANASTLDNTILALDKKAIEDLAIITNALWYEGQSVDEIVQYKEQYYNVTYRKVNFYNDEEGTRQSYVMDVFKSVGKDAYISETNKLNAQRAVSEEQKRTSDALGTTADTKDKTTAYGILAAANAKMTEAKAMAETTDAEKEAKRLAIKDAEAAIATATDRVTTSIIDRDAAKAKADKFNAALAALDLDAYNTMIDGIIALIEKNEAALEAYNKAEDAFAPIRGERDALNTLYWNSVNLEEAIATCEGNIADAKKNIEKLNYELVEYTGTNSDGSSYIGVEEKGVYSKEAALAKAKEDIEILKSKIEAKKIIVASAKAALDAEIAK